MRRQVATLAAIAALLSGACAPGTPSEPVPGSSPGSSAAPALAGALRDEIDVDAILRDLRSLEAITMAAGGTRSAGGPGEANAVAFVIKDLEAAGLEVTRHQIDLPAYRQTGPGAIKIQGSAPTGFEALTDFKPLLFSPSGDVTAPIVALGFDRAAAPGSTAGRGCEAGDWAGFPRGSIALVQPGTCRAREVVERAQDAGAAALVRSYPGWTAGHVLRPTLLDPAGLAIPVVGTTGAVGLALDDAATSGKRVRVAVEAQTTTVPAATVLAETPGGDPGHVVMLGGHLDSVIDGPGINDDGSGAMTILEIGRRLGALVQAGHPPTWKVRLAFWTGEEIGLWGSFAWFQSQSSAARGTIAAYLNFDMLGSPNGVREVYHWSSAGNASSAPLETLLGRAFQVEGLTSEPFEGGSSDDLAFAQAGIPTSGLFSGHNTLKTPDQEQLFGGTVGEPLDPCYHLACDTFANIDPVVLGQMARAAGWVTGYLAAGGPGSS
jgi:Zn-dependent M28 family amino/carboxypeptidase